MNRYDRILEKFTDKSGNIRSVFENPFRVGSDIVASDAHALCKISENKCEEYQYTVNNEHTTYPDVSRVIPETDCYIPLSFDRLVACLKEVPEEAVVEYKPHERECYECDGSGSVEWSYTDSEGDEHEQSGDCPICNGRGYLLKERLHRRERSIAIGNECFSCALIIQLTEAMLMLNCREAHILNRGCKNNAMLVRIEDGVDVLIMPQLKTTVAATMIIE